MLCFQPYSVLVALRSHALRLCDGVLGRGLAGRRTVWGLGMGGEGKLLSRRLRGSLSLCCAVSKVFFQGGLGGNILTYGSMR